MYISAKDNVNIKKLASLFGSSKERREQGEFAVEGARNCIDVLCEGAAGGAEVTALFYTKQAVGKYFEQDPEALAEKCGCKCFEISPDISQRLSEGRSSQGVFLTVKMLHKSIENLESGGKLLVLDGLQDPGNVGTILRTCDAVGVSGAVLTGNCCDVYNPKVVRAAMGSIMRVPVYIENDFDRVVKALKNLGYLTVASVIGGGVSITEFDFGRPCALFIGNEGSGMPKEHISLCDSAVTIKMHGRINSLNAATAASIMLWEMFR